ncbi:MAG: ABC transporter substrate-binding protein [Acidimicrobiia bacterium]|nr:ABC transporter substrate-binding protein [Acidimicrobiia bacterium]
MRRARLTACSLVLGTAVVGCTNGDDTSPPPTDAVTTTSTSPPPDGNNRLTIGFLLPRADDSALGEGVNAAARQAVDQINEAGGVIGRRVRVVAADEGTSSADTQRGYQQLADASVDAVIGPTSSLTALSDLDTIVGDGVLACSPTASALALDEIPDEGLFFRTIPSDSLQAVAIAELAEGTGAQNASIVYVDDAYGRGLAQAVTEALQARSIAVSQMGVASVERNLTAEALSLLAGKGDVAIILGDDVRGPRLLTAMGDAIRDDPALPVPDVIVNDAMRQPDSPEVMRDLPGVLRTSLQGVSPMATPTLDDQPGGLFGTNAFDCVTTIALAAEQAQSDRPLAIAAEMQGVSSGGSVCRSYDTCRDLIAAGRNIDYEGPGGVLELDETGDSSRARFDVFGFDSNGIDESLQQRIFSSD